MNPLLFADAIRTRTGLPTETVNQNFSGGFQLETTRKKRVILKSLAGKTTRSQELPPEFIVIQSHGLPRTQKRATPLNNAFSNCP